MLATKKAAATKSKAGCIVLSSQMDKKTTKLTYKPIAMGYSMNVSLQ
jgi:hypothetical protein